MRTQILGLCAFFGIAAAFGPPTPWLPAPSLALRKAAPVHYRQAADISMAAQPMLPPAFGAPQSLFTAVKGGHLSVPSDDVRGDD